MINSIIGMQTYNIPLVSAKAWSIVKAKNGKSLWGKGEQEKREIASLTKMMTSYIVC
jgi:D-alanyl-D-alanine carboxypeptidase